MLITGCPDVRKAKAEAKAKETHSSCFDLLSRIHVLQLSNRNSQHSQLTIDNSQKMNQKITIPAFILMVIAQLYVPASMIFMKERVITEGTAYKFRTAPIDPNDPFRGKYVALFFNENAVEVEEATDWAMGEPLFASITTDSAGYAVIKSVSKTKPKGEEAYIKAYVEYSVPDSIHRVYVRYPFDRFYMEEFKAPVAETVYAEASRDSNQIAYALVMVRNGDAVVADIFIDNVSIREVIRNRQDPAK
jgi:uncharacterized membrane-anchored protein